jgi:hypothetical protein
MKKNLKYYVVNYIPYAFELDIFVKEKILQYFKRKHQRRKYQ